MREQQVLAKPAAAARHFGVDARRRTDRRSAPAPRARTPAAPAPAAAARPRGRTARRCDSRTAWRRSSARSARRWRRRSDFARAPVPSRSRPRSRRLRASTAFDRARHAPLHAARARIRSSACAMMSSADPSQNSWPSFFSCHAMPWRSTSATKVARRVARERRAAEVGILRQVVRRRRRARLVKLQRPPPEMRIFSPSVSIVLDEQHAAAARARLRRAHHAGGAGADDDDVVTSRASPPASSPLRTKARDASGRTRSSRQGPKNSRTLSNQFLARGLCAPGSCALIASNSRSSSFCRAVSLTGVSIATWQKRSPCADAAHRP